MKSTNYKKLLLFFSVLVLAGCVATTNPPTEQVDMQVLHQYLLELPGAVVDLSTMTVAYPGDVLFASGSVLPFPGGMEVLDPLIIWMLRATEISGEALVRSSGHAADYDRILAEKRRELLERLFRNRGITADRLKLVVDEGTGAPLEIRFN